MNCANHPDVPAVAYCRTCGKPLCSTCSRDVRGVVYCEECLASHLGSSIPPAAAEADRLDGSPRPGLAALLGLIPGVGAMYNGEFAKGFVHVLIFATLIWMADHVTEVFGLGVMAFYIYMPIEAYKTARARQAGLPAPDPFGFNNWFSSASAPRTVAPTGSATSNTVIGGEVPAGSPVVDEPPSRVPVGAYVLIGLGVLFLLDEVGALHFDWIWRFWPLILIAIGVRMLMQRQRRSW